MLRGIIFAIIQHSHIYASQSKQITSRTHTAAWGNKCLYIYIYTHFLNKQTKKKNTKKTPLKTNVGVSEVSGLRAQSPSLS